MMIRLLMMAVVVAAGEVDEVVLWMVTMLLCWDRLWMCLASQFCYYHVIAVQTLDQSMEERASSASMPARSRPDPRARPEKLGTDAGYAI